MTEKDIGSTGAAGSFTYTSGTPPSWSVQGAGSGLQHGGGDQFGFVNVATAGNIELESEVFSQGSTGSGAEAGLMVRQSLATGAAEAMIAVTPGAGLNFYYKTGFNGTLNTVTGPSVTAPVFLRLTVSGNTVTGLYSTDQLSWTSVGSATITMPAQYYCGFAVSSSSYGTLNTSVFKYFAYMTSVPQTGGSLVQWLRSDAGVTASSGVVSTWADQSAQGNDASQSTSALRPTVTTGSVNSGILPTVTFDGSSTYLSVVSDMANLTSGASIFVVLNPATTSGTHDPCAFGNASNSDAVFPEQNGANLKLFAYNGSTSSNVATTNTPLTASQYQLVEEIFQPGASPSTGTGTIFVDGVQKAQATNLVQSLANTTRSASVIGAGIGPANYFNGSIAEILVFNTAVTPSQRAMVEAYVKSKFDVGNTPTLDQPTFTPSSAIFAPGQTFTLGQGQNATSFFTTDGSTPSGSSQWFNGNGVPVGKTMTVKAIAVAPFFNNSSVATATYTVDQSTVAIPRSGLIAWLKADSGVSTTGGANVTGWSDVSGNGNSASQSNSSNRPTLVEDAINGLPAINFNGSSQFLQLPSGFAPFNNGLTAFILTKPVSPSSGARFFDLGNGSASDNIYVDEPGTNSAALHTYNGSSGTSVTSSSAITPGQFQLLEIFDNGTGTASIATDSVQGASSTSMGTINNTTRANNFIGQASAGGSYFQGQIAELLIWNRKLTAAEQAAVEGFMLSRYQSLNASSTAAPIISVAGGTLTEPTQVAIFAPADASVFITLDNSTPTTSSTPYTVPVNITYTQTLKAIAVVNGVSSSVSSASYTLNSTKYPAPNSSDTTPLQLDLQLPNVGIPQDSNQP